MRLLLDTHVAIWALMQPSLLPDKIKSALQENPDEIFVSSVAILEISIKNQLKKHSSPPFGGKLAIEYFEGLGFQFLPVTPEHAAAVDELPPHHRDPFDRLLVAQAKSEPMYLVSKDPLIALYDCPMIGW